MLSFVTDSILNAESQTLLKLLPVEKHRKSQRDMGCSFPIGFATNHRLLPICDGFLKSPHSCNNSIDLKSSLIPGRLEEWLGVLFGKFFKVSHFSTVKVCINAR